MKAQRRWGLTRSWVGISAVFLFDVGVLALASNWPDTWQKDHVAWWVGVAVAVLVTIAAMVTYRGIAPLAALAGWLWNGFGDPEAALTAPCTPAIDHQRRFGRDVVGVREYRGRLVAVIAVDASADAPSGRHHQPVDSAASLPVDMVAAALRQLDLRVDGIDIVSVETRRDAAGDAPATGRRRTWLVLRMDPYRNAAAVASRDSVASALAVCAERLARALDRRKCAARPVTSAELDQLDRAVLAGMQPTWRRPGWRYLKHADGCATSFWVSPWDLTSETLDELWLADTDATVVTVRVTARGGRPQVSALVRYHSSERLPKDLWTGLNPLTGRQLAAVRASLPAPAARSPLVVPARELHDDEQLTVSLVPVQHDAMDPAEQ